MPKTLWNAGSRQELLDRLGRLKPDARPLWGRMNAPQMVAHLVGWMRMATGELLTAPLNRPIRYPPLKQMIIYWLPRPKGVPTAPELISREIGRASCRERRYTTVGRGATQTKR